MLRGTRFLKEQGKESTITDDNRGLNQIYKQALLNRLSIYVRETKLGFQAEVFKEKALVGISIADTRKEAVKAALEEALEEKDTIN